MTPREQLYLVADNLVRPELAQAPAPALQREVAPVDPFGGVLEDLRTEHAALEEASTAHQAELQAFTGEALEAAMGGLTSARHLAARFQGMYQMTVDAFERRDARTRDVLKIVHANLLVLATQRPDPALEGPLRLVGELLTQLQPARARQEAALARRVAGWRADKAAAAAPRVQFLGGILPTPAQLIAAAKIVAGVSVLWFALLAIKVLWWLASLGVR